ncbi:hypothetical protein AB1046_09010 [Promicromonospora sp. Populi]|uniref:hypothetical protein n=1 Tax=Promicromonospora sp. Populi TaxID=3239420 RepID=UPI0034E23E19
MPSRLISPAPKAMALGAGVAALLALGGCTALGDQSPDPSGSAEKGTANYVPNPDSPFAKADVDPESGTITLPVDRYFPTEGELRTVHDARGLAMAACAAESGMEVPWRPGIPEIGGSRLYGVWLSDSVAEFGYAVPTTPERDAALARDADAEPYTDGELQILDECYARPEIQELSEEAIPLTIPLGTEMTGVSDAALDSAEGQRVFADLDVCLQDAGLERMPHVDRYLIRGTSQEITEQNIQTALKEVECKTSVEFVARLAAIEAQYQAPVVEKYEYELAELRADFDALVERARQYLSAHRPAS